ncbi:MAG: hypothetical protein HY426_03550 [Candidatus Levybacteria bacterium]|nr:hypothetical protein [Candidatus Levybacteria bacterium]
MENYRNHLMYYLFLTGALVGGLILVVTFSPNKSVQMLIVVGISFLYFLIGIMHHLINHDLVAKIVIEYVLIACLGIAAAFFIFKGGFGF